MKTLKTNWLIKHTLTVFSCVLIVVLGIAFLSHADPVTTTIGENIATNDLSVSGNVTSGTWQGTAVGTQYGGTGQDWSAVAQGNLPYFSAEGALSNLAPGTAGQFLKSQGTGSDPAWANVTRSATFVVAANDSSTLSKQQADYVCDGTDDQVEIQAALDALPVNGGTVVLSSGQFYIAATIEITAKDSIIGQGINATNIYLADNANTNMIEYQDAGNSYFFLLSQLSLHGNKANNTSGWGVHTGSGGAGNLKDGRLKEIFVQNFKDGGIYIKDSWGWIIDDVIVEFCEGFGIYLLNEGHHGKISNVKVRENDGYALYVWAADCMITNSEFHSNGASVVYLRGHRNKLIGCEIQASTNTSTGNLLITGTSNLVVGCRLFCADATSFYININAGSRNIISNSLIEGRVRLDDALADNRIVDNFMDGIQTYGDPFPQSTVLYKGQSDLFMDVLAVSTTAVHAAITGTGAEQEITTAIINPDVARNISVTTSNVSSPSGNVTITGVNAKGNSTTEDIAISAGGTAYGSKAFATVSKITIPAGVTADDTVAVGISDKLGLSNIIYASGDVYKVKKNNADATIGTVNTTYGTVDCATINNGDDFTIYYKSNLNIIN